MHDYLIKKDKIQQRKHWVNLAHIVLEWELLARAVTQNIAFHIWSNFQQNLQQPIMNFFLRSTYLRFQGKFAERHNHYSWY